MIFGGSFKLVITELPCIQTSVRFGAETWERSIDCRLGFSPNWKLPPLMEVRLAKGGMAVMLGLFQMTKPFPIVERLGKEGKVGFGMSFNTRNKPIDASALCSEMVVSIGFSEI